MKKLLVSTMAAALVISFAVSAEAAGNKQKVSADVQASCKAQAAKKYSAIHFLKRLNFVNNCIAQYANAKTQPKAKAIAAVSRPSQQLLGKRLSALSDLKPRFGGAFRMPSKIFGAVLPA
jgi:hypothetical protein